MTPLERRNPVDLGFDRDAIERAMVVSREAVA